MGETKMGFGKHANKTYLWVYYNDNKYADWAQTTNETEHSSPQLQQFVSWVAQMYLKVAEQHARDTSAQEAQQENAETISEVSSMEIAEEEDGEFL